MDLVGVAENRWKDEKGREWLVESSRHGDRWRVLRDPQNPENLRYYDKETNMQVQSIKTGEGDYAPTAIGKKSMHGERWEVLNDPDDPNKLHYKDKQTGRVSEGLKCPDGSFVPAQKIEEDVALIKILGHLPGEEPLLPPQRRIDEYDSTDPLGIRRRIRKDFDDQRDHYYTWYEETYGGTPP